MRVIWEKILELEKSGKSGTLVTVVKTEGASPQVAGAKMLVTSDGEQFGTIGGGTVEYKAKIIALQLISEPQPLLQTFDLNLEGETPTGMICGGRMTLFFEPIRQAETVLIFGAGHIGSRLCKLAKFAGFRVIVVDDRKEYASEQNLPDADVIINEPFHEAIGKIHFGPHLYIAIVSRAHAIDLEVLKKCISKEYKYIGMIGSRQKASEVFKALRESGISEELISRVHSPIGLPIGGQSPEEIAISIIAEMIKIRNMNESKAE
jgi:xanthine dehydrogenase accessory factor